MNRYLALGCLLLVTVACGQQADEQPAPAQTPETPAQAAPQAPAAQPAQPAQPDSAAIEAGEQIDVDEEQDTPIEQRANIQLAQAMNPPAPAAAPSRWKPGVNYQVVTPAQPTVSGPDKIEVMEIFWYGCSHCYALEPFVTNWDTKKRPANVEFVRTPVMWGPVHREHAKLYYIIDALGRTADLHAEVFREVQDQRNMLASSDPAETERLQLAFFRRFGVTDAEYRNAARSMTVDRNLRQAEVLTRRYYDGRSGVTAENGERRDWGVPLLIVNGKYAADVTSAGGRDELFTLANDLAALEKK
jgi:thiol:disulfide interchange protein DsbA